MMVMVMVTPFSNSSATQKGSGREGFLWIYTKIAIILLITFCKAEFQLFNRSFSQLTFFFFKQKTAYEISACLVGSEMCIRDSDKPCFFASSFVKS